MDQHQILQLDPIIHAPTRLAILSILITVENANFTFLKESIGVTDGNLSTHLTKLESSGIVTIEKTFKGKKPQTICAITDKGRDAFKNYLDQLEQIVQSQKHKK
ncbi:MAG TPA: transcriptional regulator [bacterium]|nr:transcriptional regulator [bacterium]HDP97808.1 transcriptional regulator [bacterium]